MSNFKVAKIAVSNIVYTIDNLYCYLVPEKFKDINIGQIVSVPFGKSFKKRIGIVYKLENLEDTKQIKNLKPIEEILCKEFLISKKILELSAFMKERYFCTLFDAIKTVVPLSKLTEKVAYVYKLEINYKEKVKNLKTTKNQHTEIINYLKNKPKGSTLSAFKKKLKISFQKDINYLLKEKVIYSEKKSSTRPIKFENKLVELKTNSDFSENKFTKKQTDIINLLKNKKEASVKEILYLTGTSPAMLSNLLKKNIIVYSKNQESRDNPASFIHKEELVNKKDIVLSLEQEKAFNQIYSLYKEKKFNVSLLFGITGSGKTSVYMKLIDIAYNQKKSVIVLLPEIALTSQVINTFYERYGSRVVIYHSAIKEKDKLNQFKKVISEESSIVVGTRSAIFLPVKNLGLVIIDEEQEDSYKSENSPRYNAKDIAKYKCYFNNCLLLLSSATPSVETFYLAKTGTYNLSELKSRYKGATLPSVETIDMSKELKEGNITSFSSYLVNELSKNLKNKKQSILLINRKGYSTFLLCRNCKKVLMCPKCSVSLIYHSANNRLICHYCGYSTENLHSCPYCQSKEVKYAGFGTQKIEEDLHKLLPKAKILRMDSDVTFTKNAYETRLKDFKEKKYDIMLGTQMVSKGLDFSDVTLVSILCADQSLYSSDYKGYERSFSLFTQVIGRAGRSVHKGKAIIQTFTPENPIIKLSAKQDYESFFKEEIVLRKALVYPPFINLCLISFKGKFENNVKNTSKNFFNFLKHLINTKYKELFVHILSPSPANILKINNYYRYKIVIKYKNQKLFRSFLKDALLDFEKNFNKSGILISADTNPTAII